MRRPRRSPGKRNSDWTNATSAGGARQEQEPDCGRTGTRDARLHLGDWRENRATAEARRSRLIWNALLDSRAGDSAEPTKRGILLLFYAVRFPNPTRASSARQLPTDHDHAVPTRRVIHRRVCCWAVTAKPPVDVWSMPERRSTSRVRFAAPHTISGGNTSRRSAKTKGRLPSCGGKPA